MTETEKPDSIEPSQETTVEGGDAVNDQTKIEWPADERGEPLPVSEVMLRSDQLLKEGKVEEAEALLALVRGHNPKVTIADALPGDNRVLTEEQQRMRQELDRAKRKFKGKEPHYGPDA